MPLQSPKTKEQIQAMREGGKILAKILAEIKSYVKPGMTGLELDEWIGERIAYYGAFPTYLQPDVNFPNNICISVNDQLVHSIPINKPFENGDLVKFDLTITYKKMCVDSAFTMVIGEEKPKGAIKHLMETTEKSLYAGIEKVKPGARIGDISNAIEKVLKKGNLGIVRDLVGHGVGQSIHMPPEVPNYGVAGKGPVLSVGDTIAIEPMASLGKEKIVTDPYDGWSIYMKDGSMCAHYEHTVLVTDDGYEILTQQ